MDRLYGVKQTTVVGDEAERHAEEIRILGCTIVKQVAAAEDLLAIRERLDRAYRGQVAECGGEARLRAIGEANLVRCPLASDPSFIDLAAHPRILAIARVLLGPYFILQQQNGVVNPPDWEHHQAAWHRDLPYQHFVSSRPIALSALWCIDEFNEQTGGTWVLLASHKVESFPSEEYIAGHARPVTAGAGDVLVFDSMLFHRAGTNRSGRLRRGINHVYACGFVRQQICLPRVLGGRFRDDPLLRTLLGYEGETCDSVAEWRNQRFARLAG